MVLCLSSESLLTYIKRVENELNKNSADDGNTNEKILIDQLFITGDGANRFMSCELINGKIELKTAKIVNPDEYPRKEITNWFHDNYCYVEQSILTEDQRQKIKDNIAF